MSLKTSSMGGFGPQGKARRERSGPIALLICRQKNPRRSSILFVLRLNLFQVPDAARLSRTAGASCETFPAPSVRMASPSPALAAAHRTASSGTAA